METIKKAGVVIVAVLVSTFFLSGIVSEAIFQRDNPMQVAQSEQNEQDWQMVSCDSLAYYKHKADSLSKWRVKFLKVFTKKKVKKYSRDTLDYALIEGEN